MGISQRCCPFCWWVFRSLGAPLPGGHGRPYPNWVISHEHWRRPEHLFGPQFLDVWKRLEPNNRMLALAIIRSMCRMSEALKAELDIRFDWDQRGNIASETD